MHMKQLKSCVILIILTLSLLPILAQDSITPVDESGVEFGSLIEGRIDNSNPRQVYYIDGLRGEVIQFELSATSGNLDPMLTVFDDTGQLVFHRDDTRGNLNI